MRLLLFASFACFMASVYAVVVITEPYKYINYDEPTGYHYNIKEEEKEEDLCYCECERAPWNM